MCASASDTAKRARPTSRDLTAVSHFLVHLIAAAFRLAVAARLAGFFALPVARRLTPPSANPLSFLSAAFSCRRFAARRLTTLLWPNTLAQAMSVPYREIS